MDNARTESRFSLRAALLVCLLLSGLLWPGELPGQQPVGHAGSDVARAQSITAGIPEQGGSLVLSRAVRPWEFFSAVGKRAGVFGREGGEFEVWVYPLKILRNFNLVFHLAGQAIPSESLARYVALSQTKL